MNLRSSLCIAVLAIPALLGCSSETPSAPLRYEPNLVQAYKYELTEGLPMQQVLDDANWAVQEMFGTAVEPKLPEFILEDEDLASVISVDNLKTGQTLYKEKLCITCHGMSGDGRGVNASLSTPYPRDYRMGVFKFKSTKRSAKPTRDDLAKLIRHGIPGTTMTALPGTEGLSEEQIQEQVDALVDYVIYLSWRGELERALIDDVILEDINVAEGERLLNPAFKDSENEEEAEEFEELWGYAVDHAIEIAEDWLDAEDDVVEVELPEDIPVPANLAEFKSMMAGEQAEALTASVKRGGELFRGKIAACNKCHGNEGKGDGQTADYDDWTKDWTVRVNLKPDDRDALIPLLARGALEPKNIQPRNFAEGVFHGGSTPQDLYRRITVGIAGTPMPAVTFVPGEFEKQDVWHLINFVRSLGKDSEAAE
ncbi:cytochrome c [Roseimaritima ulvae]|uniref:Cytochrome c n=1 Tax=Roseimaritima ulvae TaxID=980254 RepID=A0A5B9R2E3_9BACT|nr:c-type cytochrome [Roseimaritima ulvae]QEG43566.1 Cytochrome c [Roseimaritima ulvae]